MAASSNVQLRDAFLRHQIFLLRYSGSLRNRILELLERSEENLGAMIRESLRDAKGMTGSSVRKMELLLRDVDAVRAESWDQAKKTLLDDMTVLAVQEPMFIDGIFKTVAPVILETTLPPVRQLRAIVSSRPFDGALLKDWASGLAREDLRRIHGAVQLGMLANEDSATIARRVIGTKALNGSDGVLQMTRRQVEAITRTAVQHIANNARNDYIVQNADIILREVFVATLDSHTTPVCRANDGKQFKVGTGPRPPLHIACRSLRAPAFSPEVISERPAKPTTTKQLLREFTDGRKLSRVTSRADLPRGMKGPYDEWARKRVREMTGQVPSDTSYQVWLKTQTKTFQEDILGVAKAKLFRDGNLTLDKFVAADGSELTLAQLASKHASAFRAAGLDPSSYF